MADRAGRRSGGLPGGGPAGGGGLVGRHRAGPARPGAGRGHPAARTGPGGGGGRADPVGSRLGELAPDFTVSTLEGGEFSLGAHRGAPTIIFFMAYWCGTCIPEAQALARLNEEYGNAINIIAIDIDPTSSVDVLNQFKLASGNGEYTWAFDLDQVVTISYRVRALDTTLILDADGHVIYRDERPTDYNTLKNVLENLES
ncbi:MAG: TlpA family protein disulfide reductase [Chloroflexi bacterium]|nr:TlpA family protein disulfide reductase [Chloroflexota bacterium]